jgi:hypothetical protein
VAGGFLSYKDHVRFGNPRKAKTALLISCAIFAALVVVGFLTHTKGSTTPVAAAVAGMYRWYAGEAFGADIARRSKEGWERHSWWMAIGWGFLFLLGVLALSAVGAIFVPASWLNL